MRDSSLRPSRAFSHPFWLASLATLVTNDVLLKGSGLLPSALTGKLSDVAGMVVAPSVLASLLGVRTRRGLALAHAAVALAFALIKTCPPAARAAEAALATTGLDPRIVVDPTDLLALPAAIVAFFVLARVASRPIKLSPVFSRGALAIAALSCVASSQPRPAPAPRPVGRLQGELLILNRTGMRRVLRVRPLKSTVVLDCTTIASTPTAFLSREVFGPAQSWLVDSDLALPLTGTTPACSAVLVDSDTLKPTVIFWSRDRYPSQQISVPAATSTAPVEEELLVLRESGGSLAFDTHPTVFGAPSVAEPEPTEGCALPSAESDIDWSEPLPTGEQTLVSVGPQTAGCRKLELTSQAFYLCVPDTELPFAAGDKLDFIRPIDGQLKITGKKGSLLAVKNASAPYNNTASVATVKGCQGLRGECGGVFSPLEVTYSTRDGQVSARAGESITPEPGTRVTFVRAQRAHVADSACSPVSSSGVSLFQYVVVQEYSL